MMSSRVKKRLSINVAIPAFNEEDNIMNIVSDVLSQKGSNFVINKLYVLLDASTDQTANLVRGIKDKRVELVEFDKRSGKIKMLNRFFRKFNTRPLVQFDADIRIEDKLVISKLVGGLVEGGDLIAGSHRPYQPRKVIDNVNYFGIRAWENAKKTLGESGEKYWITGQARAFSVKFLKNFTYPASLRASEDIYSFYWAKKHGYKYIIRRDAKVLFKLPDSFKDYSKQMNRYLTANQRMSNYFNKELINKYETMSKKIRLLSFLKESMKDPFITANYLLIHGLATLVSRRYVDKKVWDISVTSKKLS